jgi:type VI protein secretion system component Hcp
MAQGESSDILMKFVLQGSPIAGESATELDIPGKPRSKLFNGFVKRQMFEIDSFKFSVGIEDDPGTGGAATGGAKTAHGQHQAAHGAAASSSTPAPTGSFQAWRSGRAHKKYPVNVQPITFTRPIDRSSPVLLQHCIKCTSFDSATLVKRKSAGSAAAGEPYLRMDFVGVLITQVDWSNDDPVKETCTFISRSITVFYRPQLPDGSLGIIRPGFWSMLPWEREFQL